MLKEVIRLNGLIIVIFIILYFAFKYLKAKDSEDNSGGYPRQSYDAGYPWNRVVPPQEDEPKDFRDGEGIEEEYEEGLDEESGEDFEEEPGEGFKEQFEEGFEEEYKEEFKEEFEAGVSIEIDSPQAGSPQAPAQEIQVLQVNIPQMPDPGIPDPQAPSQIIPEIEAPEPEAFGLKMPDPMSITTTEIVVDSEVQLDAELPMDKLKK